MLLIRCLRMARLGRRLKSGSVALRNLPQVVSVLRGLFGQKGSGPGPPRAAERIVGPSGDPRILQRTAGDNLRRLEEEFCRPNPRCRACPVRFWCATAVRRSAKRRRNANSDPRFIDLFSGAGGLSLGFEQAGFRLLLAADADLDSVHTFRMNRPWLSEDEVVLRNIQNLVTDGSLKALDGTEVVIGGPPCQTFSLVGLRTKGLESVSEVIRNDPRTWLPILFARASIAVHPTVALMENVPHFMSALGGEVARRVLALYKRNGYATLSIVIRCERFGVAQARRRLLLL